MKVLRVLLVLFLLAAGGVTVALATTRPDPLPDGTTSAARLAPGPFAVEATDFTWVDATRPTDANGDFAGSEDRTFAVTLWSPREAPGPHPLLIYSHGFMSNRQGGRHLAEHMASHGYVVVATDYPLSHFGAPGGPNAMDVVNQPADVSFLIDTTLGLGHDVRPFDGGIDRDRIGVLGLSLGGLTTTLVAFHPTLGDPRIRAAISIAGPSVMFGPRYFDQADVPFLMIAGTHDAMIRYEENGLPIPDRITDGGLVTLDAASHAAFSSMAAGPMRLLGNPDSLGCRSLLAHLDLEPGQDPFPDLGGPEDGLLDASDATMPCEVTFEDAMSAGRQHWLTTLAVRAFFGRHFAEDEAARAAHARFLEETFPSELEDVDYAAARRSAKG
ncbi:MAG: hypothetical protein AAGC67_02470 [Myxococcota bacterium]